jgi:tetratricopeptide (TPR) repeat protein
VKSGSHNSSDPEQIDTLEEGYLLEECQVFSQSLLWELQRHYFMERGIEAWRKGEVPHYVAGNLMLANGYAEIVAGCLADQNRLAQSSEPLYICELGAGSGRFAFHFLDRLTRLCRQANLSPTAFRYVLTDAAALNLDFWRAHPRFKAFFDSGLLEVALLDISQSDQLTLQLSGQTLSAGSLNRPLVVIANYVFDSIPQDLFYLDDQQCHQCLVSLLVDEDPETLTVSELLERVQCHYDYRALDHPPYQEPELTGLLDDYQHTLTDTHLLFPAAGLQCLQRLKSLSQQGLLLLSADKGDHNLSALHGRSVPEVIRHGSFSLNVNYHAFKTFCEQSGGIALFPDRHHDHINVNCLLMLSDAAAYVETQRAYQRHVQDFSPDDFYSVIRHARRHMEEMSLEEILAYMRFSYYDSHQFAKYLPRLIELAPELDLDERETLMDATERVWASYFPIGEELDLAYEIAGLLYEMDDFIGALTYFERSIEVYGPHTGTLYNMAACYQLVGQSERAESLLLQVLKHDPNNQEARDLLAAQGSN